MVSYFGYIKGSIAASIVLMVAIIITTTTIVTPTQAETGKGEDIFKVIMTIFGVDKSKGDVIAIVTTNNGVESRVKFLDSEAPYVIPLNSSDGGGSSHLIEYVATFPNVTVNAGDDYKACVLTTKDLDLICKAGNNSPASRPEFVDLSLNATGGGVEQAMIEETGGSGSEEEEENGEEDEAIEGGEGASTAPPAG